MLFLFLILALSSSFYKQIICSAQPAGKLLPAAVSSVVAGSSSKAKTAAEVVPPDKTSNPYPHFENILGIALHATAIRQLIVEPAKLDPAEQPEMTIMASIQKHLPQLADTEMAETLEFYNEVANPQCNKLRDLKKAKALVQGEMPLKKFRNLLLKIDPTLAKPYEELDKVEAQQKQQSQTLQQQLATQQQHNQKLQQQFEETMLEVNRLKKLLEQTQLQSTHVVGAIEDLRFYH